MNTLSIFNISSYSIPKTTSWYLSDLGEFLGKQELYTRQSPQKLKTLPKEFTLAQLEYATLGVSREMVRRVLVEQKGKLVDCIGRGPGAKWRKK